MTYKDFNPGFDQAHFAQTLRTAMARKGFTQDDLADALEARTGKRPAQTTISYWLRRDDKAQLPSIRLLPPLLDALDLPCTELFPAPPKTVAYPAATVPRRLSGAALVKVPRYAVKPGRLRRSRRKMIFDAQSANNVPTERLGGVLVPAAWDRMVHAVRTGYRMLLEIYNPPVSLRQVFDSGAFFDGIYVVSFTTALKLYRLQELPGAVVALLCDQPSYRQIELNLLAGDDAMLHARALFAAGPV